MKRFVLDIEILGECAGDLLDCRVSSHVAVAYTAGEGVERVVACRALAAGERIRVSDLGVQPVEERLDELSAGHVRESGVEAAGVSDEIDGSAGTFCSGVEALVCAGEAFLDGTLLQHELLQLAP